jgi:hypothetical protein
MTIEQFKRWKRDIACFAVAHQEKDDEKTRKSYVRSMRSRLV